MPSIDPSPAIPASRNGGAADEARTNHALPGDLDQHPPEKEALAVFVAGHDLQQHLDRAVTLAELNFSPLRKLAILHRVDPETGEEWVTVRLVSGRSYGETREAYHRFLSEWVRTTPTPIQPLIRLSYAAG